MKKLLAMSIIIVGCGGDSPMDPDPYPPPEPPDHPTVYKPWREVRAEAHVLYPHTNGVKISVVWQQILPGDVRITHRVPPDSSYRGQDTTIVVKGIGSGSMRERTLLVYASGDSGSWRVDLHFWYDPDPAAHAESPRHPLLAQGELVSVHFVLWCGEVVYTALEPDPVFVEPLAPWPYGECKRE